MEVWFFSVTFLFLYNGACDALVPEPTPYAFSYEYIMKQSKPCEKTFNDNLRSGRIDKSPPKERQQSMALTDEDRLKFRLLNAEVMNYHQAKYTVMYDGICSGTIIHRYWVITSAHCGFTSNNVFAGADYALSTLRFGVCAHYPHTDYTIKKKKNWFDFDIQLLLMEVPFEDNVTPVRIYNGNIFSPGKKSTTVTGWGSNDPLVWPMQPEARLRKLYMQVMYISDCPGHEHVTGPRPIICLGYPTIKNGAACFGDSGGPATVDGKLIGIIALTQCRSDSFIRLTNVMSDDMRTWLRNTTLLDWL